MAQRVVWAVILAFFAFLAVAASAKIVREQNEADDAPAEVTGPTPRSRWRA
jgi:hypothetical protein